MTVWLEQISVHSGKRKYQTVWNGATRENTVQALPGPLAYATSKEKTVEMMSGKKTNVNLYLKQGSKVI